MVNAPSSVFAGRGDEEALAHSEQPVQTLPGDADEDAQCVSAVLRSLHKTQRVKKTNGENKFWGTVPARSSENTKTLSFEAISPYEGSGQGNWLCGRELRFPG